MRNPKAHGFGHEEGAMRRFAIGLAVTVVSGALLARATDWSVTISVLKTAHPDLIALAVTCLVISLAAKAARWRLLLPDNAGITTPRLYRILHISFLLNNVLPARLGDVARVAMTSRQPGVRLGHVISSLLTERVTDSVTLLAGFVLVSPFLPVPESYRTWLHVAWFVAGGLLIGGVLATVFRRPAGRLTARFAAASRLPVHRRIRDEAKSFREGWRQLFSRRRGFGIWGWSWTAWAGAFAINYLLMRALDIDAPITVAVLLTCTTNLAMLIPSSPGYIGVFHAAATVSLLPFDVGASRALSFAILAHLVNVLPVSLLGAAFLLWGRESAGLSFRAIRQLAKEEPAGGATP